MAVEALVVGRAEPEIRREVDDADRGILARGGRQDAVDERRRHAVRGREEEPDRLFAADEVVEPRPG